MPCDGVQACTRSLRVSICAAIMLMSSATSCMLCRAREERGADAVILHRRHQRRRSVPHRDVAQKTLARGSVSRTHLILHAPTISSHCCATPHTRILSQCCDTIHATSLLTGVSHECGASDCELQGRHRRDRKNVTPHPRTCLRERRTASINHHFPRSCM
jgi:hypothetical protein